MNQHSGLPAALLVAVVCFHLPAAQAELEFALYGGHTHVPDTGVEYRAGQIRLTLHDVSWESRPFVSPIYYGLRLTYWSERNRQAGVSLDFAHPKIYADDTQSVAITGSRQGETVDAEEPVGNTLQSFNNSHGLNLLTLNALYRWNPDAARAASWSGRLQPYLGVGGGIAYPHVEVTVDGQRTYEYQTAGAAIQAQAGVRYAMTESFGLFTEYKYNRAWLDESLNGGGSVRLQPHIHQFVFGIAYTF